MMMNNLRTVVMFILATLIATSLRAQTEEPDWQDFSTHGLDLEGSEFSKEAAEAVLKAVLYGKKMDGDSSIEVTNLVEFCDDLHDKRCFAAALYTVDPSQYSLDEMQFLVWLDRIRIYDDHYEYRKLWELRTGEGMVSGSLSVIDPAKVPWVTPCLIVKTSGGAACQSVQMRMFCRGRSDYPDILWEYTGDYFHESTAQAFRKSTVTFRDTNNDQVNELILDTIEGYRPGWETGDQNFKITKHRSVFHYKKEKFVATTLVPGE